MQCLLAFIVAARKGRNVILCLRRDFTEIELLVCKMVTLVICDSSGVTISQNFGRSIVCD